MRARGVVGSIVLLALVGGTGAGLGAWKLDSMQDRDAAAASQPEPVEAVVAALAREREHRATTTSIGTVLALQSITLRNEEPGTVREVMLTPGRIVEEGTVLVALDVSVEEAELRAHQAQARLAETLLERVRRANESEAVSALEVDRARAERDVAVAQIARLEAIIDRKTIRAPFRARVGLADVHPGQYLEAGTLLTTLQSVDEAVHVDFAVIQQVAAGLRQGQPVEVFTSPDAPPLPAVVAAVDALVDEGTRNAMVRALVEPGDTGAVLMPGASVRVRVPVGPERKAVAVPVSALRKGPGGDHVFVIVAAEDGVERAQMRPVTGGPVLGDEVLITSGLEPGERIAASGSFKLREGVKLAVTGEAAPAGGTE
ncbi:MAG TPA: efflux RND transporter periplasmic adaptor subunit [Phycisphaerales bacterium]|nr:efflux RND transporter periplasmic adaptor subunit [Phycisphaerales bacterium]